MLGIWLIQLGTPVSPLTKDCRRYLREFLMDARVVDIPAPLRWMLINLIIAPFRSPKSAHAYRSIWMSEGSPLRVNSENFKTSLQQILKGLAVVELSMRYGSPSIEEGWQKLKSKGVDRIIVCPMYPQYASASSGSSLQKVFETIRGEWNIPSIQILPPFYDRDFYIDSFVEQGRRQSVQEFDHILFSYHGLPERQIRKSDPTANHCLESSRCCEVNPPKFCYRAQAFATTRSIAEKLNLSPDRYSTSFQSRLGRTPWIKPFTDECIDELAKQGVKRLAVFSPSFVSDCLETLEEIGIRGKDSFLKNGGTELRLIPSLNADTFWVQAFARAIQKMI